MADAALADEFEVNAHPIHRHMSIPQRRETERVVLPRVLFIADADRCDIEQADERCQDFFTRKPR
jgi:hypothetical protein